MSPSVPLTAAEVIATGKRLVAAIESAMMATAPGELIELLALRIEREAALKLLQRTERRALAMRRVETELWRGTRLHAKWPQVV